MFLAEYNLPWGCSAETGELSISSHSRVPHHIMFCSVLPSSQNEQTSWKAITLFSVHTACLLLPWLPCALSSDLQPRDCLSLYQQIHFFHFAISLSAWCLLKWDSTSGSAFSASTSRLSKQGLFLPPLSASWWHWSESSSHSSALAIRWFGQQLPSNGMPVPWRGMRLLPSSPASFHSSHHAASARIRPFTFCVPEKPSMSHLMHYGDLSSYLWLSQHTELNKNINK